MNETFKALADENRRKIIKLLIDSPLTASEIGHNFNFSAPSLTHHLKILLSSGLIEFEKVGQNKIFTLNKNSLQKFLLTVFEDFEL